MLGKLKALSPTEFENLTYDLLVSSGLQSVVWRTPGADGGRDLEGTFSTPDFSGFFRQEKWYIECKRYAGTIDWPTVYVKIAYAESNQADYLLLVTTANPTPNCESEIQKWNTLGKRVKVRVWRGYEIPSYLTAHPAIAAKYGLTVDTSRAEASLHPLMFEIMKLAQTSYVMSELGQDVKAISETNASLSELASSKFEQLKKYGRLNIFSKLTSIPDYPWLLWDGPFAQWDEIGLRAFLCFLRHLTGAASLEFNSAGAKASLKLIDGARQLSNTSEQILAMIATLSNFEIETLKTDEISLRSRP